MAPDPKREPKYPLTPEEEQRLDNEYTYHAPKGDQVERYGEIRNHGKWMAKIILESCPPSKEREEALSDLRRCIMSANAAIAINE